MIDKAIDPFDSEEIPSRGYLAARLWAQDVLDISEHVRNVVTDFLKSVSEENMRGIDLVVAWITSVQENPDLQQKQVHFPTTNKGYPLFPIVIDEMQLEPSVRQSALAFYAVADPNYANRVES